MRRAFVFLVVAAAALGLTQVQGGGGQEPPKTNPPGNQTQNPPASPPKPKDDTIEKIRQGISSTATSRQVVEGFFPIGVINGRAKTEIRFKAQARIRGKQVAYAALGAPGDAMLDPVTGDFNWTPILPGTYAFELVATATDDANLSVRTPITIIVTAPLALFGYDFFTAPRAAILARLQMMNGLFGPMVQPNADGQRREGQVGDQNQQNQSNENGNGGNGSQTTGSTGTTGATGTTGTTGTTGATGTTGTGNGNGQGNSGGGTPVKDPNQPITGSIPDSARPQPPKFLNTQTADALRFLVGPFDMMGNNVFTPAPDRYQLGPGDSIEIRYSSPTMDAASATIVIDQQGRAVLPGSGQSIVLRGQTLQQAERLIQRTLSTEYRDVQVTATLKELRTMSITVLGDAFMPGSYQVPSVATLFNVLYMFGGPTDTGSLRRIELRRPNGQRRTFDLYRFLVFGDASQDAPLQPGDTIFIPTVEARATVDGEVGRPGVYEVLPNENLKEVLRIAGGVKASGVAQRVSLSTVQPGAGLKLRDIDLSTSENPPVYGGDKVQVFSVRPVLTNVVSLEGAVDQPGQYELAEGMTVRGLLERARGVIPGAYMQRADLFRVNEDQTTTLIPLNLEQIFNGQGDVPLKVYDRIRVYKFEEVMWMGGRKVTINGAVRRPGVYARPDGMKVIDLVLQAGGLDGGAFQEQGFLQRYGDDGVAGELVKVDFRKAAINDAAHNVTLRDNDVLQILTVAEAGFVPDQQVRILGSVQRPGEYPSSANLTIKDLIELAGGALPGASDVVEVAKARVPENTPHVRYKLSDIISGATQVQIEAGDLVTIPGDSDFRATPRTIYVSGAVRNPGPYSLNGTTDRISDIIERAGGVLPNGFKMGTQYFRNPKRLMILSHERLSPRIREVLAIISEDEYNRAVAKSEVEKMRLVKSVNSGAPSLSIPGVTPTVNQNNGPAVDPKFTAQTVSKARPLTDQDLEPGGNLNVNLENALKHKGSRDDIVVEDGDIIIIPETPSTVSVGGAVTVPSALLFEPGKTVGFYLDRCGGLMPDAAEKSMLVFRANGQVVRATKRTRIELGDYVFVPTKVMAEKLTDKQAEIDAISRNITSAGLMFAIIRTLLR